MIFDWLIYHQNVWERMGILKSMRLEKYGQDKTRESQSYEKSDSDMTPKIESQSVICDWRSRMFRKILSRTGLARLHVSVCEAHDLCPTEALGRHHLI